jgi:hypothetical protein
MSSLLTQHNLTMMQLTRFGALFVPMRFHRYDRASLVAVIVPVGLQYPPEQYQKRCHTVKRDISTVPFSQQ